MRRQCISRLTCGFHGPYGEDFTISKEKFALYDDVSNTDKNLLDYDILVIDCELYGLPPCELQLSNSCTFQTWLSDIY